MFRLTERKDTVLITLLILILMLASCGLKHDQDADTDVEIIDTSVYKYGVCVDSLNVTNYNIESGDLLSSILSGMGFTGGKIEEISQVQNYKSAILTQR